MFCPQCGSKNPDSAYFCMKCGSQFPNSQATSQSKTTSSPAAQQPQIVVVKKGSGLALILFLVVGLGVVAVIVAIALGYRVEAEKDWLGRDKPVVEVRASDGNYSGRVNIHIATPTPAAKVDSIPAPAPAPPARIYTNNSESRSYGSNSGNDRDATAVNSGAINIPAGNKVWFGFSVDNGGARLHGSFRVSGGENLDIKAYVVDADNLSKLKSGDVFYSQYASGRVRAGNIDVGLAPGYYYLVFDNGYSVFTGKTVYAPIRLQ